MGYGVAWGWLSRGRPRAGKHMGGTARGEREGEVRERGEERGEGEKWGRGTWG